MEDFKIEIVEGKANVYTPYSRDYVEGIKKLGGKWNAERKFWKVDEKAVEDVRELMRSVYGRDDNPSAEMVDLEVTFKIDLIGRKRGIELFGRTIARAYNRDGGATVGNGVVFVKGKPHSGGSTKNWETQINEGTIIKIFNVPKPIVESTEYNDITVKIINSDVDIEALRNEKLKLQNRIDEIDKLLTDNQVENEEQN